MQLGFISSSQLSALSENGCEGKVALCPILLCIYGLTQDLGTKLVFKGSDLVDHWKTSSVTSSWLSVKLEKSEAKVTL